MLRCWSVHVLIIAFYVNASSVDWPSTKAIVVPLAQRQGHQYMMAFDYKSRTKRFDYAGVAVLVDVDDITFGLFPYKYLFEKKESALCVTFQDGRGSVQQCSGYFLLVQDRYILERKPWKDAFGKCHLVQFHYSVLVLIKYDVRNEDSPKFVGTYSQIKDRLYYTGDNGVRVSISNFKRKLDFGVYAPDRYEVICVNDRK